MNDLEKLRADIIELCKNKFDIFYCGPITERKNYIQWEGNNFKDFLSLAEKLKIELIYFFEAVVSDEENPKHNGKIGSIEVGFLHNGIFHTFVQMTDWFLEEIEESEKRDEEEIPKQIVESSVEELSNEMIKYINKEYKESSDILKYLSEAQKQFWLENGIDNVYAIEPRIRLKLKKVESKVEKHFHDLIRKKEEENLPSLINECIIWCKNQGLTKLTRANAAFFLNEKNIILTEMGEEKFYLKVNHELKK